MGDTEDSDEGESDDVGEADDEGDNDGDKELDPSASTMDEATAPVDFDLLWPAFANGRDRLLGLYAGAAVTERTYGLSRSADVEKDMRRLGGEKTSMSVLRSWILTVMLSASS